MIYRRSLKYSITVVPLFILWAPAAAQNTQSLLPAAELHARLEKIRVENGFPALAAAAVQDGKIVAADAVGIRKMGANAAVTVSDQFHLGSCTKAMTAVLIGMMIEEGKLRWDSTLAQEFSQIADTMQPAFRNVTIRQLLCHRSGVPSELVNGLTFWHQQKLPIVQQRMLCVKLTLAHPAASLPGTKYEYSNSNYIIASAILEKLNKMSWEDLIEKRLFKPLGMKTAGFGPMGSANDVDQPWPHQIIEGKPVPIYADNPAVLGPAGRVHCSIIDWAKFAIFVMNGAQGRSKLLQKSTFQELFTPPYLSKKDAGADYAAGWLVVERSWGDGMVLTHAGSNTLNYSVIWLAPKKNFGVVVTTNVAGPNAAKGTDASAALLIGALDIADKKSSADRR